MEDLKTQELKFSVGIKTSHMYDFLIRHTYRSFSGILGVMLSLAALVLLLTGFAGGDKLKNILLLVGALLFTVIHPLQLLLKAKQQVLLTPMFKEPLDYTFNDKKIRIQQKAEHMDIAWDEIYKVVETKKSIILYTSPVRAYIFPKDQIEDKCDAFKQLIQTKVQGKSCKLK